MYRESRKYSLAGYVGMIVDFFTSKGWYEMTQKCSGAFTVALLGSPCGKMVCKISIPEYSGNCYSEFAKWATTQNNEHLPKIYQARSLRYYDLFLTIMERLDQMPIDKLEHEDYYGPSEGSPDFVKAGVALKNSATYKNLSYLFGQNLGSLAKTVSKLVDRFGMYPNDMHFGNMMLRGKTVVITDPYYTFRKD